MPNWKYHLDISDLHTRYEDNELTIQQVAIEVALRLRLMSISSIRMDEIINDFNNLSCDDSADADDYDEILASLYDWADLDNRMWIDTFPKSQSI